MVVYTAKNVTKIIIIFPIVIDVTVTSVIQSTTIVTSLRVNATARPTMVVENVINAVLAITIIQVVNFVNVTV